MEQDSNLTNLAINFNRRISILIRFLDSKTRSTKYNIEIDRIKRLFSICKSEYLGYILEQSVEPIWKNKQYIINKDKTFLESDNLKQELKSHATQYEDIDDNLINEIYNIISYVLQSTSHEEEVEIWCILNEILTIVGEFLLIKKSV